MAINIRTHAIDILLEWQDSNHYADSLISRYVRDNDISQEDRNLLNAIVIGVIRNITLLDHYILKLRDGKIDIEVRTILRVGIFQLVFMGVAEHAAVNETVNAVRRGIRGLINACLRKLIREKESLVSEANSLPAQIKYSHPNWLYNRWLKTYTADQVEQLLEWNQQPTQTLFRTNPLISESNEIINNSDSVTFLECHPDFYYCKGLPQKDWIDRGLIYIQDPATTHAANLLDPAPEETILDACAAPGGKSTQMAALMQNQGVIICTDSNVKRLPRLEDNLDRLGVKIAETSVHDWTEPAPSKWHKYFDAILLDVPCSNTGVLRKRVDARWRTSPEKFNELRELQLQILENALPCLKTTGRIVYSTCSIEPDENTQLIKDFLSFHPELTLIKERQITPFENQTDGAYVARLEFKT